MAFTSWFLQTPFPPFDEPEQKIPICVHLRLKTKEFHKKSKKYVELRIFRKQVSALNNVTLLVEAISVQQKPVPEKLKADR